ncbi:MAG TPA: zf-HC2 domain-containing protein [Bryobacteraceae bacterium]|nr:zf-HC2 domain-containing protein [Bryobacteraceae bacterium]
MNCAEWEERIALLVGRDLADDSAEEVERHLAGCAGCREFAAQMRQDLVLLREWHGESPAPAHFAAVRARVLAQIEEQRPGIWPKLLAYGLAAVMAVLVAALVLTPRHRRVLPSEVAFVPPVPVASTMSESLVLPEPPPLPRLRALRRPSAAIGVPAALPVESADVPAEPAQPLMVKLITNDPNVVIYWIADAKGE